jgi:hypothetical protein
VMIGTSLRRREGCGGRVAGIPLIIHDQSKPL